MKPEKTSFETERRAPYNPNVRAPIPGALPTTTSSERYVWDPFALVADLDRNFEALRRNMETMLLPSWSHIGLRPLAAPRGVEFPAADVADEPDGFVVTVELPGFAPKDLNLEATSDRLVVEARREEKKTDEPATGFITHERSYASLRREFTFPANVIPGAAKAELKNGVLTVRVPKEKPSLVEKAHRVRVE